MKRALSAVPLEIVSVSLLAANSPAVSQLLAYNINLLDNNESIPDTYHGFPLNLRIQELVFSVLPSL